METIGVESLVADPRGKGEKEILEIIDQAFEQRERIRVHLEQKMPEVRKTVLSLFKDFNV